MIKDSRIDQGKALKRDSALEVRNNNAATEGVTDPDYCVVKFTAEKGRYYSNFKSEDFCV